MLRAFENLAGIGALALENAAGVMQAMREDVQIRLGPGHEFAVIPNDALEAIIRLGHGFPRKPAAIVLAARISASYPAFASRAKSR
jgi:hypothetical protein